MSALMGNHGESELAPIELASAPALEGSWILLRGGMDGLFIDDRRISELTKDGQVVGFSVYDASYRNFFGPTGVDEDRCLANRPVKSAFIR